jgi:lipid-A-disaccharide synthase
MRIFVSAGEPSGDLHAGNLVRELKRLDPAAECAGFGGSRLEAAGGRLLYPLADHAVMGFFNIPAQVPKFYARLRQADRYFRDLRPDAVVLIDLPGFHWWLAAAAKKRGIPVISFVPPQVWAWATHRANWVRRSFDHVLCPLPFEAPWYHARGVLQARYVGHPYFDELHRQRLDPAFVDEQRARGGPIVALLPGSRGNELDRNLTTLIRVARRVHGTIAGPRFLFACYKSEHKDCVDRRLATEKFPAEAHVGRTAEIIHLADACVAVSGSVGLELLHHGTPTVVVYRVNAIYRQIARLVLRVPYISLVNLLAGRELFPEYLTSLEPSRAVSEQVLRWLTDPAAAARVRADLAALREQVGRPGACRRAAEVIAEVARGRRAAAA